MKKECCGNADEHGDLCAWTHCWVENKNLLKERDALREENEKLREQCDRYDHIIPSMAKGRNDFRSALKKTRAQLAEAVKEIERLKSELATR